MFGERSERSAGGELISVTINSGVIKANTLDRKDNSSEDKSNYKKVEIGDIAYNSMRMWQGASGVSNYSGILSPAYTVITPNRGVNSVFFAYMFKLTKMIQTFQASSQGLTSDTWNLKYPLLKNICVFVPCSEKQKDIGNFFRTLDDAITLHEQKLEMLKELKKGYLQQMFPQEGESAPRIRFAGFDGAWERRKLGEVVEFNPRSSLPESFEYVDLEAVVGTSLISHRTETKDTAPSRAQRVAKSGDVFFQTVRPYQKNNYLFELPGNNYVFSTGYAQLRPKIDSYFLLSKLQEEHFVTAVIDHCTGTSYPAININDLAEIPISLATNFTEQIAIGNFFRKLDEQVSAQQQKLNQLKQLKSAYLKKMFI